jgi:hypothetical protein
MELSYKINHHLHSDHTLFLKGPGRIHCDACFKSHHNSLFYDCSSCEFQLDIKCANRLPINPNDCHHEFFPIQKPIQFNCEVCGEEIKNIVNLCSICTLLAHKRCVEIPRVIKIKLHNHFLTLTYSIPEIKKHDDVFCRMCYEKVNTKYAIYYCHECRYVAHVKCVKRFRDLYGELYLDGKWFVTSDSMPNEFVGHATHLIKALNQAEDEGPHHEEIEHFSHQQHKLILCYDRVNDDKICEGCKELIISVPFYSCMQCNFFIHTRCTKLPTRIEQHRLHHFHPLTLLPRAPTKSGVFFCDICSRHHRGFTYKCVRPGC